MVDGPQDYRWYSIAANTGQRADALVTPHAEYIALGHDDLTRHANYSRLVQEPVEQELIRQIRESRDSGYPLASDAFKIALAARLGRRTKPGRPGRPGKTTDHEPPGLPEIGL